MKHKKELMEFLISRNILVPDFLEGVIMSIPMFPDDEITRINDNVFIHKVSYEKVRYKVYLQSISQYFQINDDFDDEEYARWTADMLVIALERIKGHD